MTDTAADGERRTVPARLGLAALNLLTPGLGLIRVGRLGAGLLFALAQNALALVVLIVAALAPPPTPGAFLILAVCAIVFVAALYLGSIFATWGNSGRKVLPLQWWRRWYSLLAVPPIVYLATSVVGPLFYAYYKPFYMPAEGMSPTWNRGDRILGDMSDRSYPRRGEVILFAVGDAIYVKRVAAIAGDRIAMRDGVPMLNGVPLRQRPIGRLSTQDSEGVVLAEMLPGEIAAHQVLDLGFTEFDDMDEVVVPAGHVFVLGDNRDRSADSRASREDSGVEMLPVQDIRGRVLFRTWEENFRWLGNTVG